ncbi:IstB domain protein ATP-binding protein [Thermosinus carboxydivorans Nor1]|uniref:IstB domain protein ATP-binding protein n=1 Tax=Thermosinus carboxydivorans Nor1 TaxID=401526 RepID=A1HNT4_9FIRM|nr:IS21-like element helper ATPase IstB [Thermosinus carboxydivorans]EAX48436.1 IstB domain protein ATP-binding protein [Thermosinus carboxydivorans Nor1]
MATRQQIDKAIKNGVLWLMAQQNADGSYGKWGVGSTCLAVMALLYNNVANQDAAVKQAIAYILNSAPVDNGYFRSLTVMALVANGEKTPDIVSRVQSDTEWLIQAQGHNPDEILSYGGWGFTSVSEAADGSSTQYALLALYAAAAWGLAAPRETWSRAVRWYQRNHDINNDGSYTYGLGDYSWFNRGGIRHSMTAAALAGLKAINALAADPDDQAQVKSLVGHALDWLNTNYIIELSPGIRDSWYYYYLYSMASGCVIEPHIIFIGTNDWYTDMADTLVALQKPDGRWTSELDKKSTEVVHTSFALLALAKANLHLVASGANGRNKSSLAKERPPKRQIRKAGFPAIKTLDTFDFKHSPRINRSLVEQLGEGDFISRKENIVLIGNPGTGKTHLAISIGLLACNRGYRVKFYTASELIHKLLVAQEQRRYVKLAQLLGQIDLLIIDELSYLTLSRPSAELLFQVIASRYERASLIITSNLELSQWATIFGDPMLTAAVVDRVIHKSHVIDTHGPSYRLKHRLQSDSLAE